MIRFGNAEVDGANNHQWFIGKFMDDPTLKHRDIEVKWAAHKKEENNESWQDSDWYSLSILVDGLFKISFLNDGITDTRMLMRRGDYVLWGPKMKHYWIAASDCTIITVRWKP